MLCYLEIFKTFDEIFHTKTSCSAEYIRGYDIDGNEKLWIVTSGKVNSLAFVDFNNDGKNEVSEGKRLNSISTFDHII